MPDDNMGLGDQELKVDEDGFPIVPGNKDEEYNVVPIAGFKTAKSSKTGSGAGRISLK